MCPDNGYLTFKVPRFERRRRARSDRLSTPNATIYALWQNLVMNTSSAVRYETVGASPDRAFVVEFEQMRVGPRFGGLARRARPRQRPVTWTSR